jgi:hypothetical protein
MFITRAGSWTRIFHSISLTSPRVCRPPLASIPTHSASLPVTRLISLVCILPSSSPSMISLANDDLAPLCLRRRDPPLFLHRRDPPLYLRRDIPLPHPFTISPCLSLLATPSFRPFSFLVAAVWRWPVARSSPEMAGYAWGKARSACVDAGSLRSQTRTVGDRPRGPLKQWGNPYLNSCINVS